MTKKNMPKTINSDLIRQNLLKMAEQEHLGILYIPQEIIPEGKVWGLINERTHGQYDDDSMQKALLSGWTPVNGKFYPELMSHLYNDEEADFHYVRKGTLLLMENDKDIVDQLESKTRREKERRYAQAEKEKRYTVNGVSVYEADKSSIMY